jgi:hypothetical protein
MRSPMQRSTLGSTVNFVHDEDDKLHQTTNELSVAVLSSVSGNVKGETEEKGKKSLIG